MRGEPSRHTPGSRNSAFTSPRQLHVSDTTTGTSVRPHSLHEPACDSITTAWTGHIHDASRRTGTRFILQIGQLPGFDSETSGCIGHVSETGGSAGAAGGVFCAARSDAPAKTNVSARNAFPTCLAPQPP